MNKICKNVFALLSLIAMSLLISCGDDDGEDSPLLSKRKEVVSLELDGGCAGGNVSGEINEGNFTVRATVPFGTDVTALAPVIAISEKATIQPASETAQDFTTPVNYTITAEDGSTQVWIVIVEIAGEDTKPKLTLSDPVWEFNAFKGNLPPWFTSNGEDGIAFGNDHVYVVFNQDQVKILDASNGDAIGDLDMTGISGGSLNLSDVETSADGSILACNVVDHNGSGTATFKIYRWATETSSPEVYLEYEVSDVVRLGDNFSVLGDVTGTAVIYSAYGRNFSAGARGADVYRWEVTEGTLNETPQIIKSNDFGITGLGSRAHATAVDVDDDAVWVNGNDVDVAKLSLADGSIQEQLPNDSRDLVDFFYNNFVLFELCDKTVMASVFPRSANESRLLIIDVTDGLDNVTSAEVIYSGDFVQGNTTDNADASGNVTYNKVSESEAEVYILITNQALAKFTLTLEVGG
ncbi:DUF4623 domain-containing protein [Fulvivirga sp. M361]|uniref:DUF5018 domain-containing protein n=1 Tax=Fulvivirga sp. M361 TaxID=2594266 RepID=UPI0011799E0A|nr:DUF5018 domain-containing protein [Fulvivirga sp. M361]TRX52198.1 DUF4623 domain-containing protein [Fulvivirga sp. M361]